MAARVNPFYTIYILIFVSSFTHATAFAQNNAIEKNNKKIITEYFNEVVNGRKLSRFNDFFSSDYTWHQMNGIDVRGNKDSLHTSTLKWLFTAIPDIRYTIDNIVAEGDMLALNTTATGTAKGELLGLAPVEKQIRFKQMFFFRADGSKLIEEWEVADLAGIRAQFEGK